MAPRSRPDQLGRGHCGSHRAFDRARPYLRLLLGTELWRRGALRAGAELSRPGSVAVRPQRHSGTAGPRGRPPRLADRAPAAPTRRRGRCGGAELDLVRILTVELDEGIWTARGHGRSRPRPPARVAPDRAAGSWGRDGPARRLGGVRRGRGTRVLGLSRNRLLRPPGDRHGRHRPSKPVSRGGGEEGRTRRRRRAGRSASVDLGDRHEERERDPALTLHLCLAIGNVLHSRAADDPRVASRGRGSVGGRGRLRRLRVRAAHRARPEWSDPAGRPEEGTRGYWP